MGWVPVALLALSPAILYGALLVLVAVHRGRCAGCGRRGLRATNWIRATVVVDGKPAPDSWSYYLCYKCGAAFKLHRGDWTRVSPEDARRD